MTLKGGKFGSHDTKWQISSEMPHPKGCRDHMAVQAYLSPLSYSSHRSIFKKKFGKWRETVHGLPWKPCVVSSKRALEAPQLSPKCGRVQRYKPSLGQSFPSIRGAIILKEDGERNIARQVTISTCPRLSRLSKSDFSS